MNVAETRTNLLACVAKLECRLDKTSDSERHLALAEEARKDIECICSLFKRKIDDRANLRFGFGLHGYAGITRALEQAVEEVLSAVDNAISLPAD